MAQHYKQQSWTERTGYGAQPGAPDDDVQAALRRNGFHNAQTSMGSILSHWVALGGALSPIIIGELIEDPAKRWKVTRLAAVGTAIAYEAVHTANELARRREQSAKLAACKEGRQAADAREQGQGRGA